MSDDELEEINHRFFGRALSTGRVAASALRLAARGALKRKGGGVDQAIGERLVKELDGMKGMAMKVGQILSYFDGVLPEGTHAALRTLQRGASPVRFEKVEAVLIEELGGEVDALFEGFDRRPIAAASIGQVHRARHEGREVAVKIQYPSVRATFEADFERLAPLGRVASLAAAVDGLALVEELRSRVVEECDYAKEAAHQRDFREAFREDPLVIIPEVIEERSSERVLTTAFAEGRDLYTLIEETKGSEAGGKTGQRERDAVAATLARFAMRSLFVLGEIQADPHPGNYLFPRATGEGSSPLGSVVFLDFGCVRRFSEDTLRAERALAQAVIGGRREAFREAVVATGMTPRPERIDWDRHWEMLRHQWSPFFEPGFRYTRAYLEEGLKHSEPSNPNLRHLAIPPAWIWEQRLLWGLSAVMVRLEAGADLRPIAEETLFGG